MMATAAATSVKVLVLLICHCGSVNHAMGEQHAMGAQHAAVPAVANLTTSHRLFDCRHQLICSSAE